MPGSEGAARGVGWEGGGTADAPSPPSAALPPGRLVVAPGAKASLLPACPMPCAALCGTSSLQSMLEEEGSPLLITFFVLKRKGGINE